MTGPKEVSTLLSPPDSDVVYSLKAIANFCGMSPGQAKPFVDLGIIPTFRLPGSKVLCASKVSIGEAWRQHQAEWRNRHPIDTKEKLRQRKQKRELKCREPNKSGLANNPSDIAPLENVAAE